jgi:mutator protein MutT
MNQSPQKQCVRVVIQNARGQTVFVKHLDAGGGWNFPGGKIEPGETSEEAGRREAKEETGLDVTGLRLVHEGDYLFGETLWHGFFFLCDTTEAIPVNGEPSKLGFVAFRDRNEIGENAEHPFVFEVLGKVEALNSAGASCS